MKTMRQLPAAIMATVFTALSVSGVSAQPVCPGQRIVGSDVFFFSSFGRAVAISGDAAVVGRPTGVGSAFVFERSPSGDWVETQQLDPTDGGGLFGDAVAIEGDVIAIGARSHDHEGLLAGGAVYMFRRTEPEAGGGAGAGAGGGWVFQQEILPVEDSTDNFGFLVELDAGRLVVTRPGAAYVYGFDGGAWVHEQTLLPPLPGDIGYGASLSIDADVLVIGAPSDDTFCIPDPKFFGSDSGIAFVYRFNGEQWALEQTLSPSDADCQRRFGKSVAVSGDAIIASAPVNPPAAYVFEYDPRAGQWMETTVFTHPIGEFAFYGDRPRSTSIQGDLAIVGDWGTAIGLPSAGAAFVYQRTPAGTWIERDTLLPQPNPWSNRFGWSVWLDQGRAIISAHGEDHQSGAAYIFDLAPAPGDLNCDGLVNGLDLGNLLANWSIPPDAPACAGDTPCASDINSDGVVDGLDLGILLANWTL